MNKQATVTTLAWLLAMAMPISAPAEAPTRPKCALSSVKELTIPDPKAGSPVNEVLALADDLRQVCAAAAKVTDFDKARERGGDGARAGTKGDDAATRKLWAVCRSLTDRALPRPDHLGVLLEFRMWPRAQRQVHIRAMPGRGGGGGVGPMPFSGTSSDAAPATGNGSIESAVINGLAKFIASRAKQELLAYTQGLLASTCRKKLGKSTCTVGDYLPKVCASFRDSSAGGVSLFALGRSLRASATDDLRALPERVLTELQSTTEGTSEASLMVARVVYALGKGIHRGRVPLDVVSGLESLDIAGQCKGDDCRRTVDALRELGKTARVLRPLVDRMSSGKLIDRYDVIAGLLVELGDEFDTIQKKYDRLKKVLTDLRSTLAAKPSWKEAKAEIEKQIAAIFPGTSRIRSILLEILGRIPDADSGSVAEKLDMLFEKFEGGEAGSLSNVLLGHYARVQSLFQILQEIGENSTELPLPDETGEARSFAMAADGGDDAAESAADERNVARLKRLVQLASRLVLNAVPDDGSKTSETVRTAVRISELVLDGDYGPVLVEGLELLNGLLEAEKRERIPPIVKTMASLGVELANATSSDEVARILESAASPAGGYRQKYRKPVLSLTSFPGVGVFRENARLDGTSVTESLSPEVSIYVTGMVGLQYTRPLGKKFHVGAYISILDLGAVMRVQLQGEDTTLESGEVAKIDSANQVGFAQVFSPGAYLTVGLAKSPVTLGLGVSAVPSLHQVSLTSTDAGTGETTTTTENADGIRYGVFMAVDVTLFGQ